MALKPKTLFLSEDEKMPNSTLPVLIYRGVVASRTPRKDRIFERLFMENGWKGVWKDGMFDYDHFHSNAHEALGVARGSAIVQLGGESGKTLDVAAGDLLVLPAGTGHKRVKASENFMLIGAYPPGQENYDIRRGKNEEAGLMERIASVPLPKNDPFFGARGWLPALWKK